MDPGSPLISGHIVTEGQKSGPFGWMGSIMDPFMPSPRQEPMGECVRWWRGAGWGGPLFLKEPARILEWVAFPFSRGSSQPRD